MVCSYGTVNACLEQPSFLSADPQRAFEMAAGKRHHSVVDAIWGYTQFLLDEVTKKLLVVCTETGLYKWQRMPFCPAPAPAGAGRDAELCCYEVWRSSGSRWKPLRQPVHG